MLKKKTLLLLLSLLFASNGYSAEIPSELALPGIADGIFEEKDEGFHFHDYHFDVHWFSGSGYVPADHYVYRWTTDPSHYLIEMMGVPGAVIRELTVGSQVEVEGVSYTIFKMDTGVPNDEHAYYNMKEVGAALTFQTCDTNIGANGRNDLTIWYANPS